MNITLASARKLYAELELHQAALQKTEKDFISHHEEMMKSFKSHDSKKFAAAFEQINETLSKSKKIVEGLLKHTAKIIKALENMPGV
jgi:hypothetical protein